MKFTKEELGLLYFLVAESDKYINFNTYCKAQLNELLVKIEKKIKYVPTKILPTRSFS